MTNYEYNIREISKFISVLIIIFKILLGFSILIVCNLEGPNNIGNYSFGSGFVKSLFIYILIDILLIIGFVVYILRKLKKT